MTQQNKGRPSPGHTWTDQHKTDAPISLHGPANTKRAPTTMASLAMPVIACGLDYVARDELETLEAFAGDATGKEDE